MKQYICFVLIGLLLVLVTACSKNTATPSPITPAAVEPSATPTSAPGVTPTNQPSFTVAPSATPEVVSTSALPPVNQIAGVEMSSISEEEGLGLIAESGVRWVRRNALQWPLVEPAEGERKWNAVAALEQDLIRASEEGLQVILIVRGTPDWASKNQGVPCGVIRADKLEVYATFLYDVVKRYSAPPYNVRYWELGNEPDVAPQGLPAGSPFGCWGDPADPYFGGGVYAGMLEVAYPQIKAADPQAQVLMGGLLLDCDPLDPPLDDNGQKRDCHPSLYLEGVLKAGGGEYFDGVSFHAYDFYWIEPLYWNPGWHSNSETTGPALINKARYLRSLLDQYGYSDKYLVNSEVALLCGRDGKEAVCQSDDFQHAKANYVAQANASALAEGLRANIWFSVSGWRASALISADLEPNLAYDALKFSAAQLGGSKFSRDVTQYPGVKGYEFVRSDGSRIWILWALDGQEHTLEMEKLPAAVYDVFGNVLNAANDQTIGAAPVYMEWIP